MTTAGARRTFNRLNSIFRLAPAISAYPSRYASSKGGPCPPRGLRPTGRDGPLRARAAEKDRD